MRVRTYVLTNLRSYLRTCALTYVRTHVRTVRTYLSTEWKTKEFRQTAMATSSGPLESANTTRKSAGLRAPRRPDQATVSVQCAAAQMPEQLQCGRATVRQCGSVGAATLASVGTPGVEVREREVDEAQGVDEVAEVEQEVVPLLRREYLRPPAQQQQHRRHVPERTCTGSDAVHVATRAGTMYAYRRRADARGHRGSLWAR